jgi:hypothetical protein
VFLPFSSGCECCRHVFLPFPSGCECCRHVDSPSSTAPEDHNTSLGLDLQWRPSQTRLRPDPTQPPAMPRPNPLEEDPPTTKLLPDRVLANHPSACGPIFRPRARERTVGSEGHIDQFDFSLGP